MKLLTRYITLSVCLLISLSSAAQQGHLYTSDRLSSGLITCICQDRFGFIWVGTEYGLNKFDGYHFYTYNHSRTDSTSICDNEISHLFIDSEGQLWVGCAKGLVRYDYEHDNFRRYHFPDNRQPRISSMLQDKTGRLLVGTAGYGLYSMTPAALHDPSPVTLHYEDRFNRRYDDAFYSRMHLDRQGNLWRSSHRLTLTKFTVRNGQPTALRDYQSTCGIPRHYIEYDTHRLLIVCMHGILCYDYRTGDISDAGFDLSLLSPGVSIEDAMLSSEGHIYLTTSGGGLMRIERGSRQLTRVEYTGGDIDMATANVVDALEDRNHNLWVTCYNKGLMLLSRQKAPFSTWSLSSQHYVTGGGVTSMAAGDNGAIWCAVQNSGIFRLDAQGRVTAHPQSPVGTRLIYRDRRGQYWLTTDNALYRYQPETGKATPELTLNGRGLNSICDDNAGRLYISNFGLGLYIYDPASRKGELLSMQQADRRDGYLCNDWIKALQFDSRGLLWICTTNGLSMMKPEGYVFNSRGWNVQLEGHQCLAACEMADGNMLIGTESGLYCYNWKQNKTAEVPGTEALHDKMICAMTRDRNGSIWISTTSGIWQYQPAAKEAKADKAQPAGATPPAPLLVGHIAGNGLTAKEYMLGAMAHQADDRISFGTADGLVTFLPGDISTRAPQLDSPQLTRITAEGRSLNPLQKHFTLDYGDNTFTMEFSLFDYLNAENIVYQYRLNGDSHWMQTGDGINQLTFNQFQPGDYRLEVRASANGIESDNITTLHLTILKPWYRSTWAYLIYGLIAAGFLALVLYNWERQRRRDLEETKMRFLINATHDIRSPLTLIMGPLRKLKQRISDPDSQAELDTIDNNAQRLLLLVNQILDERKIDKQQMKLSCTETDLVEFVRGIFKLYEYNAIQRSITFTYDHPGHPVKAWIDREQFDKVISNLLSNAFKYTFDGGEINIRLTSLAPAKGQQAGAAEIQVIDTGMGFEDDKTERFFERFYQGKSSKDLHINGTGIGLNLSRALTEMHGGRITAQNRKDGQHGAILTVTLPLGKSHLKPDEIAAKPEAPQHKAQAPKTQGSRNLRILLVDDDIEIARYIKAELGEWYKFDYVPNGREALKLLLTKPFDLVVSDVMMPEMDGVTLLRSIKTNSNISDVPVILLTSKSEVQFRLEGFKKGADAFLAKPFSMEELHILIDNLVDNVRRLRGKFSGAQGQDERLAPVKVKGNDDALMEKVMRCVNENLSNPDFDVETLTRDVGISRAQLHRKMKELTGISTSEFVRNLRLEQAARLIREKKINVTQVAYSVGFNNQAHFSTIFKKHFGMTPTEYAASDGGGADTE